MRGENGLCGLKQRQTLDPLKVLHVQLDQFESMMQCRGSDKQVAKLDSAVSRVQLAMQGGGFDRDGRVQFKGFYLCGDLLHIRPLLLRSGAGIKLKEGYSRRDGNDAKT